MSNVVTNNLQNNGCAHELDSSYLSNGRLHPAVIRSNNRTSRPPSWYLLRCEASQLEAEMSDEDNALEYYLKASVMIRYNNSSRLKTLKFTTSLHCCILS